MNYRIKETYKPMSGRLFTIQIEEEGAKWKKGVTCGSKRHAKKLIKRHKKTGSFNVVTYIYV